MSMKREIRRVNRQDCVCVCVYAVEYLSGIDQADDGYITRWGTTGDMSEKELTLYRESIWDMCFRCSNRFRPGASGRI